jgi:transcriptional regulator with XRE-family HTH domain
MPSSDQGRPNGPGAAGGTGDAGTAADPNATDGTQTTGDAASELWEQQQAALGGFIRVQRRLADMSLREMAALTSVSNAYLSQVERGLHQPSLRVLRSIAQALSIAPEELLRRANFMSSAGAISADPRLTPAQREALLNVYRSFRTSG